MRSVRSFRRRPRRPRAGERLLDPRLFQEWAEVIAQPNESSLDAAVVDRVRDAIEKLPRRQREVINGLFYEKVRGGQSELARRMGLTRHEVRNLLLDAQGRLERALR